MQEIRRRGLSGTGVRAAGVQPSCMCMVWAVVLFATKNLSVAPLARAEADGNLHLAWHGSFPRTGDAHSRLLTRRVILYLSVTLIRAYLYGVEICRL